jgi:hypothetical protein
MADAWRNAKAIEELRGEVQELKENFVKVMEIITKDKEKKKWYAPVQGKRDNA